MSETIFADGIGPIVVVGGTVRLDFVTLVADEGGVRPKTDVQHHLIMPIDGFLAAARRLAEAAEAIAKMEPRHAQPTTGFAAEPAAVAVQAQPVANSSPPSSQAMVAAAEPPAVATRPKPPFP